MILVELLIWRDGRWQVAMRSSWGQVVRLGRELERRGEKVAIERSWERSYVRFMG